VVERGGSALTEKDTAGLRLSMWKAATPLIRDAPIVGRGLGMYWDLYLPELGYSVRVFPHSLYVMVLVNLGAVGLFLCAWLWVRTWKACASVRRSAGLGTAPGARRLTYATLGLASLGAIAAYGVGYAFEPYSITLSGICLAGAMLTPLRKSRDEAGSE